METTLKAEQLTAMARDVRNTARFFQQLADQDEFESFRSELLLLGPIAHPVLMATVPLLTEQQRTRLLNQLVHQLIENDPPRRAWFVLGRISKLVRAAARTKKPRAGKPGDGLKVPPGILHVA